jgi:hypothetical protein
VKNPGIGGQNVTVRAEHFRSGDGFRVELRGGNDRAFLIDAIDRGACIRLAADAIVVKVIHPGEQITDGRRSVRNRIAFVRTYWPSMSWRQRRKNVGRIGRLLIATTVRRFRSSTAGR